MATIKTSKTGEAGDSLLPTLTGYLEVSREYNSGDGTGRYITYKYRGSKDALRLASADWVSAGGKYTIVENGPYSEATVVFGGNQIDPNRPLNFVDPELEQPSYRFEFRTDYYDASIFELPKAREESERWAKFYSISTPPAPTESDYFSKIKLAGENPNENPFAFEVNGTTFPIAKELVLRWARGQQTFQSSRVSLTRISSYSALNGLPKTPPFIASVYSSTRLANGNGFPDSVSAVMPSPPADPAMTPKGTVWSWLKTNDSTSLIIKTNQVERNETWTFAAWDLFVYPYYA